MIMHLPSLRNKADYGFLDLLGACFLERCVSFSELVAFFQNSVFWAPEFTSSRFDCHISFMNYSSQIAKNSAMTSASNWHVSVRSYFPLSEHGMIYTGSKPHLMT